MVNSKSYQIDGGKLKAAKYKLKPDQTLNTTLLFIKKLIQTFNQL